MIDALFDIENPGSKAAQRNRISHRNADPAQAEQRILAVDADGTPHRTAPRKVYPRFTERRIRFALRMP